MLPQFLIGTYCTCATMIMLLTMMMTMTMTMSFSPSIYTIRPCRSSSSSSHSHTATISHQRWTVLSSTSFALSSSVVNEEEGRGELVKQQQQVLQQEHHITSNSDSSSSTNTNSRIPPLDSDHGLQYLDPLKQYPTEEAIARKLEQQQQLYDQYPALASSSSTSSSSSGSNYFFGENNNNKNEKTKTKGLIGSPQQQNHQQQLLLQASYNDERKKTSNIIVAASSSHFESHRNDLGWYANNNNENDDAVDAVPMHYANLDFFAFDQLTYKGPRTNADAMPEGVKPPEDSGRPLCKIVIPTSTSNNKLESVSKSETNRSIACGSWFCTMGGWPSKTPRPTTEVFYVWKGFGCLTDLDGTRHYFSPGSTVILPKGWSGRWDIAEDVHKVWVVHDHEHIEEDTTSTIRAKIIPYNELVASSPLLSSQEEGTTQTPLSSKSIYEVGPTKVSLTTCLPFSSFVWTSTLDQNQHDDQQQVVVDCFHILEGSMVFDDKVLSVGDTVVLPMGYTGRGDCVINQKETVKLLRIQA